MVDLRSLWCPSELFVAAPVNHKAIVAIDSTNASLGGLVLQRGRSLAIVAIGSTNASLGGLVLQRGRSLWTASSQPTHLTRTLSPLLHHTDRLRDLEKKTGQPKAYIFFGVVFLIVSVFYSLGGFKLISDVMAFIYPAYMSFKAIESPDPVDDTQWLTYWVVFSLFSIVENVASFLIAWIPFYYVIKIAFFAWLCHPKFMGAGLVYKQVVK